MMDVEPPITHGNAQGFGRLVVVAPSMDAMKQQVGEGC